MAEQQSLTKSRQSPFTLLAVTALSISNLMVGVLQGNTFLVLASSVLSGGFAYVYAVRSGMISGWQSSTKPNGDAENARDGMAAQDAKRRFPLWLFLAVIFVMMPAILLFLQSIEQ